MFVSACGGPSIECADSSNTDEIKSLFASDVSQWEHSIDVTDVITAKKDDDAGNSLCKATVKGNVTEHVFSGEMEYEVRKVENSDKPVRVTVTSVGYQLRDSFRDAIRNTKLTKEAKKNGFTTVETYLHYKDLARRRSSKESDNIRIEGKVRDITVELNDLNELLDAGHDKYEKALATAKKQGFYIDGDTPGVVVHRIELIPPQKHGSRRTDVNVFMIATNKTSKKIVEVSGVLELFDFTTNTAIPLTIYGHLKRSYFDPLLPGKKGKLSKVITMHHQDRLDPTMKNDADYAVIFIPSYISYKKSNTTDFDQSNESFIYLNGELTKKRDEMQAKIDEYRHEQTKFLAEIEDLTQSMNKLKEGA